MAGCGTSVDIPGGLRGVSTIDVHDFVAAWQRLEPGDTLCAALERYFEEGTHGLRAYRLKFAVGRPALCHAVLNAPAKYAAVLPELPAIDSAADQLRDLFAGFKANYLEARLPAVYLLVGTGVANGAATTGGNPFVLVAIENNASIASIRSTVAHQFGYTQQHYPAIGAMTTGPAFLRASLLRESIAAGCADFLAELLTGDAERHPSAEEHEADYWKEFQNEMHGKVYDRWLFNAGNPRLGDRPAELGRFIGYRIVRAYYDRSGDKEAALHDILHIQDFDKFLAASGYQG